MRPLPTINPVDFWGYCYDAEPELIRQQFGEDITRHLDKERIVQLAREHPDLRERCVRSKEQEGRGLRSQLPTYLRAEQIDKGIFLVACQRDQDFGRVKNIREIAVEVSSKSGIEILVVVVDCRANPTPASRL